MLEAAKEIGIRNVLALQVIYLGEIIIITLSGMGLPMVLGRSLSMRLIWSNTYGRDTVISVRSCPGLL